MFQEDLSATTSHKDQHNTTGGYTSLLAKPIRLSMGEEDHEEESTDENALEVSVRVEYAKRRRGDRKEAGT
jgi:hypothetical protein